MSHSITGLVARKELLEVFASQNSLPNPREINQGFGFLPLRDEDIDAFVTQPQTEVASGFTYLSKQLALLVARASKGGAIVYVETDYFGGVGEQGAAAFSGGQLSYGPFYAEIGPINEALASIGVTVSEHAVDEFDAVGLNRHRHTDDWLEAEESKRG
ncbi:hypothetical protein [Thiosocius teredinicola]|uniref:hypothetical protein n=1 Tax=Thiosocius teredinicola TaxID=1973002 RepID=UPI000F7AEC10